MTRPVTADAVTETQFDPAAVRELLELWKRVMPREAPNSERFRDLALLDPQFRPEGLTMLFRAGRLIGFSYAVAAATGPGAPQGWLAGLGVAPEERRAGHGTRLLASSLRFLAKAGCSSVRLGGNGERYLLPGADPAEYPEFHAFIQAAGFTWTGSTEAMACDVRGRVPFPDPYAHGSYVYRQPRDGDYPELLRVAAAFSPGWAGLVRSHLARTDTAPRIWIACAPGRIVGFAASDLFPGCSGRFGPMGVLPETRGQGVGGRLVRLTLGSMAARGLPSAWFLWGPESDSGRRMYESAGFRVNRRFDFFSSDLTPPAAAKSAQVEETA
jgi:ribosomal protein S18 acetylase RimI-like enzyme